MIITETEAENRINSLDNLINKLKTPSLKEKKNNIVPFVNEDLNSSTPAVIDILPPATQDKITMPFMPPSSEDLIDDLEAKLTKNNIKKLANSVLEDSLKNLSFRLDEVDSPKMLSKIASEMSSILKTIDPPVEKGPVQNQVVIYRPVVVSESHYETRQVSE